MKPLIQENYIDTGKVRFEFRHFPWIGPASKLMAQASMCAQDQGEFWEYHDHLYGPGRSARSVSALVDVADELGLDKDEFAACLSDERHAQHVEDEYRLARGLRLTGTPAFIVNNEYIINGPGSYDYWVQVFDILLGNADTQE